MFLSLLALGFSAMYGPPMVILAMYFKKRRTLAAGLSIGGGSVGSLVMPWIFEALVEEYGYTGSMMIFSGILLNAVPALLLLRPISTFLPPSVQKKQAAAKPRVSFRATMKGLCAKVFDKELLTSGFFLYIVMLMTLGQVGFITSLLFAPAALTEIPSEADLIVLAPALMGGCELLGRVIVGLVGDNEKIPKNVIFGVSVLLPGVALLACFLPIHLEVVPESAEQYLAMLAISLTGMFGSANLGLISPMLSQYFGVLKLPSTVGLCTFSMGLLIVPFPIGMGKCPLPHKNL